MIEHHVDYVCLGDALADQVLELALKHFNLSRVPPVQALDLPETNLLGGLAEKWGNPSWPPIEESST